MKLLSKTDKESFEGGLNDWHTKWDKFLKERSINPKTNKTQFTHRRLRSAYNSLKNNLPWLFTWHDFMELKIPNTTNGIDGHFADLKNKLRNHNRLLNISVKVYHRFRSKVYHPKRDQFVM